MKWKLTGLGYAALMAALAFGAGGCASGDAGMNSRGPDVGREPGERRESDGRGEPGERKRREPGVVLRTWERGIAVEAVDQPGMAMYLWFYEWHMFDAVNPGQHTQGGYAQFTKQVSEDGRRATLTSDTMKLTARAVADGAELELTVRNASEHDWPACAGIIPCFNPGPKESANPQFTNTNTWFVSAGGLVKQQAREIHFNDALRAEVDALSDAGTFVFSKKWPTSEVNAAEGLIVRESGDGTWVTGIAWEDFLSAQGHNPWQCMHLSVRVGPLKRGESRTTRGKIYLFRGDREACFKRYVAEFE